MRFEPLADISIPLHFGGPQPNAFGVEPAAAVTLGDTRRGSSVNFQRYTLTPHCSGTHTECVGHITNERVNIIDCLRDVLMQCLVISVEPELSTTEKYASPVAADDRIISRRSLAAALAAYDSTESEITALAVRTLPNTADKLARVYDTASPPPFFSNDAMDLIVSRGICDLLVDLPSIDRLDDGGKLSNHRIFWNMPADGRELTAESRKHATITELIYISDEVPDGEYWLNLQIAPFAADASPSRPILGRLIQDRS